MFSKKSSKTPSPVLDDQESARAMAARVMQADERPRSPGANSPGANSPGPASPGQGKGSTAASAKAAPAMPSLISADLKIEGDVESLGDLQLDGRVIGDLDCRNLTIGLSALVEGSVRAENVTVAGTVRGRIDAGAVVLVKTAKIFGDILHDKLSIEAGALLDGRVGRRGSAPKPEGLPSTTAEAVVALPSPGSSGNSAESAGTAKTGNGKDGDPHSPV